MMTNLCLPSSSRVGFIYTFWCYLWSTCSILEYIYMSPAVQQGPWKPENLNLNLKFQVQVKSSLTIISFKFSSLKLEEVENFKSSQVWKVKNLTWLEIYYWNNKKNDQICWWFLEEWGTFHWMKESNWHGKKMSSNLLSNQPRKDLIL